MSSELEHQVNQYCRFKLESQLHPRRNNGEIITDPDELVIYAVQHIIGGLTITNLQLFIDWYKKEQNKDYNDIEGWYKCKDIYCVAIKTDFGQVIFDTTGFNHVNIMIDINNFDY